MNREQRPVPRCGWKGLDLCEGKIPSCEADPKEPKFNGRNVLEPFINIHYLYTTIIRAGPEGIFVKAVAFDLPFL